MELEPLSIPNEKALSAIISMLLMVRTKLDIMELGIAGQEKPPMSSKVYEELHKEVYERHRIELLATFGE